MHILRLVYFVQKMGSPESDKTPQALASAFLGPLPKVPAVKRGLRLDTTATSDLGDICESDMFEQVTTPEASPESADSLTVSEKVVSQLVNYCL